MQRANQNSRRGAGPALTRLFFGILVALPLAAQAQSSDEDLFTGKTMTGDWGGTRTDLYEKGINLRGGFIDEAMGVADGGLDTGARNAFQTQVGVDLDMGKLTNFWGDARFHFTINDRRGRGTSNDLGGNSYMPIQEIYSDQFTRISELSYDQNFFKKKLNWKVGYYVMGNHFGLNMIMTNFVNAALCAHPISLSTSAGWTNWPRARWGTHFTVHPTDETTVKAGMFLVNTNHNLEQNRWRLHVPGTTGHMYPVEFEWAPGSANGGHYQGHYKIGYYYDTSDTAMKGDRSDLVASHRDGGYLLTDQKLTNNAVGGGLSVFANYTAQSQETAVIHRWFSTGLVYQALFQGRPNDRVALGYVRASINDHLLKQQLQQQALGLIDDPDWQLTQAEELWELAYTFQVRPWLSIRPDVQYITNPGTYSYTNIDNVLAAGVQFKINF